MSPTIKHRIAAALALAAVQPVHALPIDAFDGGFTTNTVYYVSGPPLKSLSQRVEPASVPGGSRRTDLMADPGLPGSSSASLSGSGDLWAFARDGQRLNFSLSYGTERAMNLDLSGSGLLRLEAYFITPVKVVVTATTETAPGSDPDGSTLAFDLPDLFRQIVDIPLGAFTTFSKTGRAVNWADVDGLAFAVSAIGPALRAGDVFWVQSLTALPVPEPSSMLLAAGGLALLAGARRRPRRA